MFSRALPLILGTVSLHAAEVTFSKDVAPILFQHCVVCHRPGDIAPMSLLTWKEARPWAAAIREAVLTRKMPPWHADPHYNSFSNDARLSDAEIQTIVAWAKSGTPEGDPRDMPAPPEFPAGWHIHPDIVLPLPEDQLVPSAGQDEYEYVKVPTHFTEDKWVSVAEVLPGDRRIVHHATVKVWSPPRKHRSQPVEDKYRYVTGKVHHIRPEVPVEDDGCATPTGGNWPDDDVLPGDFVAIYLPGHVPEVRPPGYAIMIPKNAVLEFQIHYSNRTGKPARDKTAIGLVLAQPPVEHRIRQYEIWNNLFAIPPGDGNHQVTSCYTLDRDVIALAYTGHMHYRGKSIETEAQFPDGRKEVLLSVPHYDFRWQETYMLREPRLLPKGTLLKTTAFFDNSVNNPLNPDATKRVRWGEPSDEEMMGFWLAFTDPPAH